MSDSVSDRLDRDFAPAWRFEPGGKVVGQVIELGEREGNFGRYPIVTLRTDNGDEFAVHAFHDVLARNLAQVAPEIGDRIGIKYLGKHPEKGYHAYRVERAGGQRGFNWRAYGTPDDSNQLETEASSSTPGSSSETTTYKNGASGDADIGDDDIPFRWEGPVTFTAIKDRPHHHHASRETR
jgi:hypothetical protein